LEIFEDSKGNLWFGTLGKGAARYGNNPNDIGKQSKTLTYFSTKDGVCGNTVVSFAEENKGNLWFATHSGVSKYDGRSFKNFTKQEGLCHDRASKILIDKIGNIWVRTWGGVCRYTGRNQPTGQINFEDFPLPTSDIEIPDYQETTNWLTEIIEDAQGNIWFGCRVAEKDHPVADKRIGDGGLSRYGLSLDNQGDRNSQFIQYPSIEGTSQNDIYSINKDKSENIWIGANGVGLYRYDGMDFTLFSEENRKGLKPIRYGIQSTFEESKGVLWLGMSGGLFRLEGDIILNVSQDGPWM
jgi:ligand-binding sensor domain-containing protein